MDKLTKLKDELQGKLIELDAYQGASSELYRAACILSESSIIDSSSKEGLWAIQKELEHKKGIASCKQAALKQVMKMVERLEAKAKYKEIL